MAGMNEDWGGLAAAKAVWDFTTGDARRFVDRLDLVIDAAEDFGKRGIAVDFVVLLHAHALRDQVRVAGGARPGADSRAPGEVHAGRRAHRGLQDRARPQRDSCGQRHRLRESGTKPVRELGRAAEPRLRVHADYLTGGLPPRLRRP